MPAFFSGKIMSNGGSLSGKIRNSGLLCDSELKQRFQDDGDYDGADCQFFDNAQMLWIRCKTPMLSFLVGIGIRSGWGFVPSYFKDNFLAFLN
jgi:hypothetical protein